MKFICAIVVTVILAGLALGQSGRRAKEISVPTPPVAPIEPSPPNPPEAQSPRVTAQKNEEYRCTDDGSLAAYIDPDNAEEKVLSSKEVDTRLVITSKPAATYTREARRSGIQGFVTLKVLFSGEAKISRLRVVKGLPGGLTENAIRAACKIKFKPAIKNGQPVSQWLTVEYVFRLADSSIFAP